MDEAVEKLLKDNGWIVECYSPLEIRQEESGAFATLWAAQSVIDEIVNENKPKKKKKMPVKTYFSGVMCYWEYVKPESKGTGS